MKIISIYPISKIITNSLLSGKIHISNKTSLGPLMSKLYTTTFIRLALFEVPALGGLIIFFISGKTMEFYLFILISLAYNILEFPTYTKWEELSKKL